jgi:uncharacterized protein (DUF1501 family)
LTKAALESVNGAQAVTTAVAGYSSTVTYPEGNSLANALKMAAQIFTTVPDTNLCYASIGGFDNHSQQIGNDQDPTNKLLGPHASLLRSFSQAVKAFYDDMEGHGLRDLVIMTFSEFGRRLNENASFGTDHGTSSLMFVIGNPVKGGLYGTYPSLAATDLDNAGNLRHNVDFRAVYSTILDRWLGVDSSTILGGTFENIGFLA